MKHLALLFLFFIISSSTAGHCQTRCPDLLANHKKQESLVLHTSQEWQRWISSEPTRTPSNEYSTNAFLALTEVFIPWINGRMSMAFGQMLRKMHRISTVGLPGVGGGPYQAFLGYRTDEIFPGMTRSDIFTQYEDLVKANPGYTNKARQLYKVHTSEDGTFDPPLFSSDRFKFTALENAIAEFKVDIFQTQGLSHTNSELNFKLKKGPRTYSVQAQTLHEYYLGEPTTVKISWSNGITKSTSQSKYRQEQVDILLHHRDRFKPELPYFKVPLSEEVDNCIQIAENLMQIIKQEFTKELPRVSENLPLKPPQKRFLRLLAEYYQTLLTSHAFVFTNQSLYMNQVNYLLKLNGFTPLYHGVIDFWSMTLQKEEFKRFFIDEVIEQHSGEFLLH